MGGHKEQQQAGKSSSDERKPSNSNSNPNPRPRPQLRSWSRTHTTRSPSRRRASLGSWPIKPEVIPRCHHNTPTATTPTSNNNDRILLLIRRRRRRLLIPNRGTSRPRAPLRPSQSRTTRRGSNAWADRVVVVGAGVNFDGRIQPIQHKRRERLERLDRRRPCSGDIGINSNFSKNRRRQRGFGGITAVRVYRGVHSIVGVGVRIRIRIDKGRRSHLVRNRILVLVLGSRGVEVPERRVGRIPARVEIPIRYPRLWVRRRP